MYDVEGENHLMWFQGNAGKPASLSYGSIGLVEIFLNPGDSTAFKTATNCSCQFPYLLYVSADPGESSLIFGEAIEANIPSDTSTGFPAGQHIHECGFACTRHTHEGSEPLRPEGPTDSTQQLQLFFPALTGHCVGAVCLLGWQVHIVAAEYGTHEDHCSQWHRKDPDFEKPP